MGKWLSRGLAFAALMVVVRLVQGTLINQFQTQAVTISVTLCTLFAIAAFAWGWVDGRRNAEAHPDPDRREDLAMTWLLAGLVAGLTSGLVSWLIAIVYKPLYTDGLVGELTTFAAFTALLAFVPAILGTSLGRWLTDRKAPPMVRQGADGGQDIEQDVERADTDVFAAVSEDAPAGDAPATGTV